MKRKKEITILSPCGILGYGYPMESFLKGMRRNPDAIVVDAGSTDAGPHKLGAGVAIVSRQACKKDLEPMIVEGRKYRIPIIIGSAGGSGGRVHVLWTLEIIQEILKEQQIKSKIAIVWGDIDKEIILKKMKQGKLQPLGSLVGELTEEKLKETNAVVAQMGHEPIVEALKQGAEIILCGRAYDPSPFAAVIDYYGFPLEYGYHAGKILECAALCAVPGTTKDCMLGIIREDGFLITPLSEQRKCTKLSVAAHTFYEKEHPYLLHGPGILLNLSECQFKQWDEKSVFVTGSKIEKTNPYTVKLEGARRVAYRSIVIAGVRDPILIEKIEMVEEAARQQVISYYSDISPREYQIRFINYGINGVMGDLETSHSRPHEIGVVMEVIANTQETADAVCASLRSTLLHYGYEGRKSTAGNLAFPFAPSDISYGPVYEFSVYHLMQVDSPTELFPIEIIPEETE